ncbi:unnamed protein product [Zymoseptoria tritici ST99CH_3D1]|nr:unnamed protein product [Zymoseptoria tritici ST99CH_3D1]
MADSKAISDLLAPGTAIPDFTTVPIKVQVGTPSTIFHVNKDVLVASSDYFQAALAPEWKEGKTRTVDLPDDDPKSFGLYLAWLHTRRMHLSIDGDITGGNWIEVFNTYALGDKLLDPDFKDALTDTAACLVSKPNSRVKGVTMPLQCELQTLYEKTLVSSTMRRIIVHKFARLNNWNDLISEHYPSAFLRELCKAVADKAGETPLETTTKAAARCAFHEHKVGAENCYRTKKI